MPSRRTRASLALAAAAGLAATVALAQGTGDDQTTRLERLLESTLSTPDRQIRVRGIEGILSSTIRIDEITISDGTGIWLEIDDVTVDWNRLALFRRRVDINRLSAETIHVLRKPAAGETRSEAAGGGSFSLPVSVEVRAIALPDIVVDQPVAGVAAVLSGQGSASIDSDAVAASLTVTRNDAPGGMLTADLRLAPQANALTAKLDLSEPPNGIVANLLNLPGRPAVGLSLDGDGPLGDWRGRIGLESDGSRILGGTIGIAAEDGGHRVTGDITGRLGEFVPADYRALLSGDSRIALDALLPAAGGLDIRTAELATAGLSASASGELGPDYVPERGTARVTIGGGTEPTGLPFLPGAPTVGRIEADASLESGANAPWSVTVKGGEIASDYGRLATVDVRASGEASNLAAPDERSATFAVEASLGGLAPADEGLAEAAGDNIRLTGNGSWRAGSPVAVSALNLVLDGATASFSGTATAAALDGRYAVSVSNLARYAGLSGRSLAGAASINATGTVRPSGPFFDLALEGSATDLALGVAALDPLFAGTVALKGGVARSEGGSLAFRALAIEGRNASATVDGSFSAPAINLSVDARVADLAVLSDRATGAASLAARIGGSGDAPAIDATLTGENVTLMGRSLAEPRARFEGIVAGPQTSGQASLSGTLGGVGIDGSARLAAAENGGRRLDGLTLTAGRTRIAGDLLLTADNRLDGSLSVRSPDLAEIAPLALVKAGGAVDLDIGLSAENGGQSARFSGTVRDLAYETARIGTATVEGTADNLFGVPIVDARFSAQDVAAGSLQVRTLEGTARREGDGTAITADATLPDGAVRAQARLVPEARGLNAELDLTAGPTRATGDVVILTAGGFAGTVSVKSPDVAQAARLAGVSATGAVDLDVTLAAENGRQSAQVSGNVRNLVYGSTRVGSAEIEGTADDLLGVPLVDARFSARDVVAGGTTVRTLQGTARREGNATAIAADAALADGSASLRARLEPQGNALAVRLDSFGFDRAGLQARLAAPTTIVVENGGARFSQATLRVGGGSVRIDGRADAQRLALALAVDALPVAIANSFVEGLGAEGTVTAKADIRGTTASPQATFDASWQGAALQATRSAGLGPLSVTANGRYSGGALQLRSAISGGGGLQLAVSGSVDVAGGNRLDLAVNGTAPLALANQQLADRGAQLSGTLAVDVAIRGTPAAPQVSGTVSTAEAGFIDPDTGIVLRGIVLRASLAGERITIERLTATSGNQGTLSATGTIGIGSGFPVDLTATMRNVRYVDENLVVATFDADLTLTGSIVASPQLGGTVRIARAEITVPEKLPQNAVAIDVMHLYAPPPVERTLEDARQVQRASTSDGGSGGVTLDVAIEAPARIFVRGRGLDAELGGRLRVQGPISAIRTAGAFDLRRGRFDIFTRRLTFDRGTLTFAGDLDPILDFTATTQADDVTVTIAITGVATDPEVHFTSSPELPEDEVLAYVLFGHGVEQLSPLQLAQLAAAAAQFAGVGSGPGILDRLRTATGLDDLDVVTDAEGGVSLRAGRYIGEHLYLGVEQGTGSESSRVTVDLEISRSVKARGEVGAEGGSKIGIYYEREY
ncbi:translocation/assembly module TamB domain-containing protein [Propylenella binzhouense]|uniref:Translocation and assembly module TamB C-terminal domain-containing protein n=1 Tax=Propylenella binzhouense TaxID=2555902 RepID=A0A964WV45_9HYPH|nr:translocation/assembly module TamB domain-containing protein [Propylenella binzhouense]MYZ49776.1 hypothetical protein [Propylenella binzhouense]